MSDVLLEKINKIERMITELNAKIDNFLGYEDLTEEEKRESKKKSVRKSKKENMLSLMRYLVRNNV